MQQYPMHPQQQMNMGWGMQPNQLMQQPQPQQMSQFGGQPVYSTMNHWNQDPHSIPTPLRGKDYGEFKGKDQWYKDPPTSDPSLKLPYNKNDKEPTPSKWYVQTKSDLHVPEPMSPPGL